MAEVVHPYVGKTGALDESQRKAIGEAMHRNATANTKLIKERIQSTAARRKQAELLLAKARGELILKTLVERQAAYLLVSVRQRILAVPDNLCRRILNLSDPAQARRILKEAMLSLLSELKDLPQAVTDSDWLRTLEADEGK
jgi:hypothetical protein